MVEKKITPMMKQFLELKEQYSDCILLFRAGDFYETFFEDAKVSSKVLGITLTKRGDVPMAGVPYHSISPYIKKLIQSNFKVALCEQLEDPKKAKGLVKRGVKKIITPGTILEDEYFSSHENNYILCLYAPKKISEKFGVAIVDISTGEFLTTETNVLDDVKTIIRKYQPNEIIHNENFYGRGLKNFLDNCGIYLSTLSEVRFNYHYAEQILKKQFKLNSNDLGLNNKEYSIISTGALLFYIYKLQKIELEHINKIRFFSLNNNMVIDSNSLRNLEILETMFSKDQKKTLYGILNNTKTPIGSRLLKKHIINPLLEVDKINRRLDSIEEFNAYILERNEIRELLDEISDIERISSRISSSIVTPKDLFSLKLSLQKIPALKTILNKFETDQIKKIKKMESLPSVTQVLEEAISPSCPAHTRETGFLNKSYNVELEKLYNLSSNSRQLLRDIEKNEKDKLQIQTLRIKYNRVFGYYIEVPKSQIDKIPSSYKIKQTLTNVQRYTNDELIDLEEEILSAEEKYKNLELELFEDLILKMKNYVRPLQNISKQIALLDVLTTNSLNSQLYHYTRPSFNLDQSHIVEGRNPIVERFVNNFVPNDILFNSDDHMKIITGPNMAGKSTILRQVALISLLGQCGMFVPARKANLKIYDRIFTRIGAHDELAEGQSTFMVEMSETALILNNATKNSLVLLDEIGRGTSTFDGLAIAWAVSEDLILKKTDTIFATHYHQLNKLETMFEGVCNYNIIVREEGDKIEFLHKLEKGGTDKSYGIYVAKLAGVPQRVLDKAKEIQEHFEDGKPNQKNETFTSNKNNENSKKGLDKFF